MVARGRNYRTVLQVRVVELRDAERVLLGRPEVRPGLLQLPAPVDDALMGHLGNCASSVLRVFCGPGSNSLRKTVAVHFL